MRNNSRLQISTTSARGGTRTVVVAVAGELDMAGAEHLRTILTWAIVQSGATEVIADATGLTFVDAFGGRALAEGFELASRNGVAMAITDPGGHVGTVLALLGLGGIIEPPQAAAAAAGRYDL